MLKRQSKTETKPEVVGPPRILVVDDNPDACRLLGKLFRKVGYEVAEVGDHDVALVTLMNEPTPISAVVASFSLAGNTACLKLLDAVRHTPDPKVHGRKVILILDTPRQQMFSWQSGADEILLRPYPAIEMLTKVAEALERPDADRPVYRRTMIDSLREQAHRQIADPTIPANAAQFN